MAAALTVAFVGTPDLQMRHSATGRSRPVAPCYLSPLGRPGGLRIPCGPGVKPGARVRQPRRRGQLRVRRASAVKCWSSSGARLQVPGHEIAREARRIVRKFAETPVAEPFI